MAAGVPATELRDEDLERELRHLHDTRSETFFNGTQDALETHTRRMLELEAEFARRSPELVAPDPSRVRAERHRA